MAKTMQRPGQKMTGLSTDEPEDVAPLPSSEGLQQQKIIPPRNTALESHATRSRAFTVWTLEDLPEHAPVLVAIRSMPDPRYLLCQFGERKDLVCNVRAARNFKKGMMLFGARPRPDLGARAWEYLGKLPRQPGRW